jgi:hypothetical protein
MVQPESGAVLLEEKRTGIEEAINADNGSAITELPAPFPNLRMFIFEQRRRMARKYILV